MVGEATGVTSGVLEKRGGFAGEIKRSCHGNKWKLVRGPERYVEEGWLGEGCC